MFVDVNLDVISSEEIRAETRLKSLCVGKNAVTDKLSKFEFMLYKGQISKFEEYSKHAYYT